LGFCHHDQVLSFAKAENLAFRTDEEKCLARDRLRAHLEIAAPHLKFAAMRTQRRLLEPALPVLTRDTVQMAQGVPSVSGMKANDVIVSISAHERDDNGYPEKGRAMAETG
jgi:putative transposase